MPRNIEIKARITDVGALSPRAAALAHEGPIQIAQDDTFFACASGRLKLRAFSADNGELIFYRRADQQGPKESFYVRSPTAAPESLREALSLAHGQIGRVVKQRTLYLIGRTRVHLDVVQDLGHFLELEVVLADDEPIANGVHEAHALMAALGVQPSQLVETAYLDLLAARSASQPELQVMPASPDDAWAVAEIHVKSWQAAYEFIVPPATLAALSVEAKAEMWQQIIADSASQLLVAKRGGQVVGWLSFGPSRDDDAGAQESEIWALYVAPAAWQSGVGRALWQRAQTLMQAEGYTACTLWVFPQNQRAINFYRAAGFSVDALTARSFMLDGHAMQEVRYRRADGINPLT